MLIWAGDVLLSYAIGGFVLFWFRRKASTTILRWCGSIFIVGALVMIRQNWRTWVEFLPSLGFGLATVSVFLLGISVYRSGLLDRLADWRGLLQRVCAWTLPIGLAMNIAVLAMRAFTPSREHPTLLVLALNLAMALSNYLLQSVVCVLFYSGLVTGLYGRVGPAVALIPTVILCTAQVLLSNWWLARFRFGPMEWIWRGLTYGEFPAMRVKAAARAAGG